VLNAPMDGVNRLRVLSTPLLQVHTVLSADLFFRSAFAVPRLVLEIVMNEMRIAQVGFASTCGHYKSSSIVAFLAVQS
jgi:hypothetical protein